MDAKLKNALDYASIGFKLFPARWSGSHRGLVKWGLNASDDPDIIRSWATRWPDCYFCVAAQQSDITILDIDNKHGKQGSASLAELIKKQEPLPATLTAKTPSGGEHLYFRGKSAITVSKIGGGIDTPVMAPIPGTTVPGKGVYTCTSKVHPAPVPVWLISKLGEARDRTERNTDPVGDLDTAHNIAAATEFLKKAPSSLLGEGGNDTAYRVACVVRDYGISESTATDLLLQNWYPRCDPNDKPSFIERIVSNAYNYALGQPGSKTPEAMFPDPLRSTSAIRCASELKLSDIKPRPWLLGHRYLPGYVTVTLAPGGAGKSTLTIIEALAVATGRKLTHDEVKQRGPVWLYNTEDPFDELDRRVLAAAKHHNIAANEMSDLFYSSGRAQPIRLAAESSGGVVIAENIVQSVIGAIKKRGIKLFIVDPFVRCHGVKENDNSSIDLVVQQFSRIAEETGCAISLVHHTKKGAAMHGEMDVGRGASALASAARIAHTLYTMGEKEAKRFGVSKDRRKWYCRLDDAKANLSPPCSRMAWFERVSVSLSESFDETTGTMVVADLSEVRMDTEEDCIRDCVMGMVEPGKKISVYQLAKEIAGAGLLSIGIKKIQSRILNEFKHPVKTSYGVYSVKEGRSGNGNPAPFIRCVEMFG